MKASRTINWYFGLCSIVKVCCEMVPIKRQVFYCHFTKKDTHLFSSFYKNVQDIAEIGI